MLIFLDHDCEIGTAQFTPATTGACIGVLHCGVAVITICKNASRAEGNADAALLAPAPVDADRVHAVDGDVCGGTYPSIEVRVSPYLLPS